MGGASQPSLDAGGDAVVVLEDVWKVYPPDRVPHTVVRALARLGGVEVDGGLLAADEDDEEDDELDEEAVEREHVGREVLRGISLEIARGSCVGIVGPPEAGKSMLLRLVAGTSPPTAGRIVVRGTVAPALVSLVRLVPSRFGVRKTLLALAMMTRLPRRQVARRLREIYAFAGVPDPGRDRLVRLSPEQIQRVLAGMMLSVDADVVLVDVRLREEGFRSKVFERVRERQRAGATVLVAAGTAEELGDLPDRIVHLDAGRIVWDGPPRAHRPDGEAPPAGEPAQLDASELARAARQLPLSADAQRYLDYIRVLLGDQRAEEVRSRAVARAPLDAVRVEWTGVAKYAGFDRVEHLAVVERLRELHQVDDEEPIFGREELLAEGGAARGRAGAEGVDRD